MPLQALLLLVLAHGQGCEPRRAREQRRVHRGRMRHRQSSCGWPRCRVGGERFRQGERVKGAEAAEGSVGDTGPSPFSRGREVEEGRAVDGSALRLVHCPGTGELGWESPSRAASVRTPAGYWGEGQDVAELGPEVEGIAEGRCDGGIHADEDEAGEHRGRSSGVVQDESYSAGGAPHDASGGAEVGRDAHSDALAQPEDGL
eukprot:3583128-Rhodomonas_salina.2